jgi:hypothetical protein
MLRWLVFFCLILVVILAFVSFVLGVPIPGLEPYTPSSPFSPGGPS